MPQISEVTAIKRNRLAAYTIILSVFILTVIVRSPHLNRPLSAHHEWLTANTLVITEVWREESASYFRFTPCTSYKQPKEFLASNQETLIGPDGRGYYISHPPFWFILPYFLTKIFHLELTPLFLQILNLILHLSCSSLIYLLLSSEFGIFSALIGSIFYLLYPSTLWFQSNVFWCETVHQVFWLLICFLWFGLLRDLNQEVSTTTRIRMVALALLIFMANLTYYMALFISVVILGYHLLKWLFSINKRGQSSHRSVHLTMMGLTLFATAAAYGTVLFLYGSQLGLQNYLQALHGRFSARHGWWDYVGVVQGFRQYLTFLENMLKGHISQSYLAPYVIFLFILSPFVYLPLRGKRDGQKFVTPLLLISWIPPLSELSFLQSSSLIHDVSVLKMAVPFALLSGMISHKLAGFFSSLPVLKRAFVIVLAALLGVYGFRAFQRYESAFAAGGFSDFKIAGEFIRGQTAWQKKMIYGLNRPSWEYGFDYPPLVFYMKRNFKWVGSVDEIKNDLASRNLDSGVLLTWDDLRGLLPEVSWQQIDNTRLYFSEINIG